MQFFIFKHFNQSINAQKRSFLPTLLQCWTNHSYPQIRWISAKLNKAVAWVRNPLVQYLHTWFIRNVSSSLSLSLLVFLGRTTDIWNTYPVFAEPSPSAISRLFIDCTLFLLSRKNVENQSSPHQIRSLSWYLLLCRNCRLVADSFCYRRCRRTIDANICLGQIALVVWIVLPQPNSVYRKSTFAARNRERMKRKSSGKDFHARREDETKLPFSDQFTGDYALLSAASSLWPASFCVVLVSFVDVCKLYVPWRIRDEREIETERPRKRSRETHTHLTE